MKYKLNVSLECYLMNPIIDKNRHFTWLGNEHPHVLKIGRDIEYIIINIKQIKLSLEDNALNELKLDFPFTYNEFITFSRKLADSFAADSFAADRKESTWLKNLQYMKDYILAPLMISSKQIIVGIIILDDSILKSKLKTSDILESNNYLSQICTKKYDLTDNEWKSNLLDGILTMRKNTLCVRMRLYIMNCRGYLPQVLINRMYNTNAAIDVFRKLRA
jgi:hypothetical protein